MNASSGGFLIVAGKVHMWGVEDLVPYARKAKKHPPKQIR